jgi:hypothetical protein
MAALPSRPPVLGPERSAGTAASRVRPPPSRARPAVRSGLTAGEAQPGSAAAGRRPPSWPPGSGRVPAAGLARMSPRPGRPAPGRPAPRRHAAPYPGATATAAVARRYRPWPQTPIPPAAPAPPRRAPESSPGKMKVSIAAGPPQQVVVDDPSEQDRERDKGHGTGGEPGISGAPGPEHHARRAGACQDGVRRPDGCAPGR